MRKSIFTAAVILTAAPLLWGCNEQAASTAATTAGDTPVATAAAPEQAAAAGFTGKVLETMDTAGYTYVRVDTGEQQIWGAAPQFQVAVGDEVYVPASMPMANYHSKTLDRTFDVVYFAGSIGPAGQPAPAMPAGGGSMGGMMGGMGGGMMAGPSGHPGGNLASGSTDVDLSGIAKAEGGNTVGELLGDKAGYAGQEVVVRAKVVKFNANILGKNWLHVRDGSGGEGSNDLTVTTDADAAVGDTVLLRGTATVDRDFGHGYKYAFIVEDAAIEVE